MSKFTRQAILSRPTYWLTKARLDFTRVLEEYMAVNDNMKRKELAEKLKCSPGYVSQMLNGDTNVSFSKLFEVALTIGKVPFIRYEDVDIVIARDAILCESSYEITNSKSESVSVIQKKPQPKFSTFENFEFLSLELAS